MNAIATRRRLGLKELAPEPVDLPLVEQLLEAANWTPSHGKIEPWRFVVDSGEARRIVGEAFGAAFRLLNPAQPEGSAGEQAQRERVWQAPVWIALGMRPDPKWPEWGELMSLPIGAKRHRPRQRCAEHAPDGRRVGPGEQVDQRRSARHAHVAEVVGFAPETQLLGFFYVGLPAGPWPRGGVAR